MSRTIIFSFFVMIFLVSSSVYAGWQLDSYNTISVFFPMNGTSSPLKASNIPSIQANCSATCPTFNQPGKIDKSIYLESGKIMTTSSAGRLKMNTTSFTLEYWWKPTANVSFGAILGYYTNANSYLEIFTGAGATRLYIYHYGSASDYVREYTTASIAASGGWHFYSWVFNRVTSGRYELWIDGVNQSNGTKPLALNFSRSGTAPAFNASVWRFGRVLTGDSVAQGYLADVQWYRKALNASQISAHYANNSPTSTQQWPYGIGGAGSVAPVVTVDYPTSTVHYNTLTWNKSIIFHTDKRSNCTLNDSAFTRSYSNGTNFRFTTSGTNRNYSIQYRCNYSTAWTNSTFWFVYDTVNPALSYSLTPSTPTGYVNRNFTLNVSWYDMYLYQANTTITKISDGSLMYYRYSGTLGGSTRWYNSSTLINLTGWTETSYELRMKGVDTHTDKDFNEAKTASLTKDTSKGTINTAALKLKKDNVNFEMPKDMDLQTEDCGDRICLIFTTTKTKEKKTVNFKATKVDYLADSPYKAHFIINGTYWIDFEGAKGISVTKLAKDNYAVSFDMPDSSLRTHSIGGLNVVTTTTTFVYDKTKPTFTGNKSVPQAIAVLLHFNSSEATNYTYKIGATCGFHNVSNGTSGVYSTEHTINAGGLHVNRTYYFNITITDIAGNKKNACYGATTLSTGIIASQCQLSADNSNNQFKISGLFTSNGENAYFNHRLYVNGSVVDWRIWNSSSRGVIGNYNITGVPGPTNENNAFDGDLTTYADYTGSPVFQAYNISKKIKTNRIRELKLNISLMNNAMFPGTTSIEFFCAYSNDYSTDVISLGTASGHAAAQVTYQLNISNTTAPGCLNLSSNYFIILAANQIGGDVRIYEIMNQTILSIPPNPKFYAPNSLVNFYNYSNPAYGTYVASCQASDTTINSSWVNSSAITIPYISLSIYDEMTLKRMRIENISAVRLDSFCDDKVERLNLTAATTIVNFTCMPNYINLWFIYNSNVTYYRTLIPSDVMFSNVSFYMIDLTNLRMIAVLWDTKVEDLIGYYSRVPFYVRKVTQYNGTIDIIQQILDNENKAHLYLVKDETYSTTVYGTDGSVRSVGNLLASSAGNKIITLPPITMDYTDAVKNRDITYVVTLNLTSRTLRAHYNDKGLKTNWVYISVVNKTDGSILSANNYTGVNNVTDTVIIKANETYAWYIKYSNTYVGIGTGGSAIGNVAPGINLDWIFPGDAIKTEKLKHFMGAAVLLGTALIFPAEYIVMGIILLIIEIPVLITFGWLGWSPILVGVLCAVIGIEAIRLVLRFR